VIIHPPIIDSIAQLDCMIHTQPGDITPRLGSIQLGS